ncbi:MAG: hypothetical protein AB7G65_15260 [Thermoleophilia bacterium]
MPARHALLATAAAVLAVATVPALATADVQVGVPDRFLGGPILVPLPIPPPDPGAVSGQPSPAPADGGDCAGGASDCAAVGGPAAVDVRPLDVEPTGVVPPPPTEDPSDPVPAVDLTPVPVVPLDEDPSIVVGTAPGNLVRVAAPAAPPAPETLQSAFGRLVSPGAASWLRWQRPVLRWRGVDGATHYNVQVFRGTRRVLNAWPGRHSLRVPDGVLKQGRTYVWVVFPGYGTRAAPSYGAAVGRSTFQITLRPRLVFRRPGRVSGIVAEIRPHVPFATLALTAPRALRGRVPTTVNIDGRGRFTLPLSRTQGERLSARLITRGPTPPQGLRG